MNVDIINTNILNFIIYSYSSQKNFNSKYKSRPISLKEENLYPLNVLPKDNIV